jgi:hypothetical protein
MLNPDEVSQLILKMQQPSNEGAPVESRQDKTVADRDVSAYVRANSWPGSNYMLIGHSYNIEQKVVATSFSVRRSASIAMVLEQGGLRRCMVVSDALSYDEFSEVLSTAERKWLAGLPNDTVIGPAYATTGELIGQSFAVWTLVAAPLENAKELVNVGN